MDKGYQGRLVGIRVHRDGTHRCLYKGGAEGADADSDRRLLVGKWGWGALRRESGSLTFPRTLMLHRTSHLKDGYY